MINANDLRRGNLVDIINRCHAVHVPMGTQFKILEIKAFSVTGIYPHETVVANEWQEKKITDLEPIPLTPEILEKCGFKKHEFGDGYLKNKIYYILPMRIGFDFCILYSITEHKKINLKYIEYVHQLQNLYFSLTGEELNAPL